MTREERFVDALSLIDTMTARELKEVGHALKARFDELNTDARDQFKVGDRVTFDAKRRGIITGVITSRVGKNIRVRQEFTLVEWRVSPTLLRRA